MKKVVLIIILLIILVGVIAGIVYFNSRENENIDSGNNLNQGTIQQDIDNNVAENAVDETINENSTNSNTINDNNISMGETQDLQEEGEEESVENTRIKLTVNGNEIFVRLDNNVASRDFLEMLPLTLTFEDFNNTEKIANLPNELSTEGLPSGYTPEIGDFAYYAPWGNISVFYKDFRYSNSLYKLGTIESGTEIIGNMSNDFEVTIERVN